MYFPCVIRSIFNCFEHASIRNIAMTIKKTTTTCNNTLDFSAVWNYVLVMYDGSQVVFKIDLYIFPPSTNGDTASIFYHSIQLRADTLDWHFHSSLRHYPSAKLRLDQHGVVHMFTCDCSCFYLLPS